MKRVISVLIAISLMLCAFAFAEDNTAEPLSAKVMIRVGSSHGDLNKVGNNWTTFFSVDKVKVESYAPMILTEGSTISLFAQFKENDKNPDIGFRTLPVTVDRELLEKGGEFAFNVEVKENDGRHKGNSCTWTAVFTIEFVSWANPLSGIDATVTANTVALTADDGSVNYLKTGALLTITGYDASVDRFTVKHAESTGYIKGIGLDIEKEQLVRLFKGSQGCIPASVTANTVALTAANGVVTYLKTGAYLTVTGYNAETDRFTAVSGDVAGEIKGIGLNFTKEQLIEMLR